MPIALGEELRTVYEYRPRFQVPVIPHASVGVGIFQAASLHASAALQNVPMHEYQHSVFDRCLTYVRTTMRCERGAFSLPEGHGLGIEPAEALWTFACGGTAAR